MTETVKLTVDGREVEVPAGASIMDACDLAGVYVPRLCAYPGLEPVGDCGLCFVRVEHGQGSAEARRACSVTVMPDMVVDTEDDQAKGFRLGSMRAILGDHPHVCLTCPDRDGCSRDQCTYGNPPETRCCEEFGRCEIAAVAAYVGALDAPPPYAHRDLGATIDHTIRRDLDLCVGCGRCVAACDTLVEAGSALELVETRTLLGGARAMGAQTDGPPGEAEEWQPRSYLGRHVALPKAADRDLRASGCTWCGACVMVCPSGALTAAGARGEAWLAKRRLRTTLHSPVLPPVPRIALTAENVERVPDGAGVFTLFSPTGEVVRIAGVADLRGALVGVLAAQAVGAADDAPPSGGEAAGARAATFSFEEEPLYTQRESELLSRHLHVHGAMPSGNVPSAELFADDEDPAR